MTRYAPLASYQAPQQPSVPTEALSPRPSTDSLTEILAYPGLGQDTFELTERPAGVLRDSVDLEQQELLHRSSLRNHALQAQSNPLTRWKSSANQAWRQVGQEVSVVRTRIHNDFEKNGICMDACFPYCVPAIAALVLIGIISFAIVGSASSSSETSKESANPRTLAASDAALQAALYVVSTTLSAVKAAATASSKNSTPHSFSLDP